MDTQKKILIIEDDLFTRELYLDVFKIANFFVDTASDGEEGLTKIKYGGWDAILLDILMPKKDGLQVLKEIQSNPPQTPNGPIFVLTNIPQDPVVQEALQYGAKSYYVKAEINPNQLVEQISSQL